jgi:hypothetical protein
VAVMVIFHPLVKVIISPNLLFFKAVAPADWPGNARRDPGRVALGLGIKYPTNAAIRHLIRKDPKEIL